MHFDVEAFASSDAISMIYKLNKIEIDTSRFTVIRNKETIAVEPQVFNLIVYLIENRNKIISRAEILESLWQGRVVSDTSITNHIKSARKALGDDGVKQQIIKTIHSRGYQFVADIINFDNKTANTINHTKFKLYMLFLVLFLVTAIIGIKSYQRNKLIQSVQKIANYQDIAYATFVSQAKRRNELVAMIEARTGEKRHMQFEKFFSFYFNQLNEQEEFVFDQIRAMTDIGLYQNNLNIVTELNNNPILFSYISGTKELHKHLTFWLNKYHSFFKKRDDMCLLYVGVEDGVPYPNEVNGNVKSWLQQQLGDDTENIAKEYTVNTENGVREVSSTFTSPQSNSSSDDSPNALKQGLVAYYPFNGNTKDTSGNSNHGIPSNIVLTTNRFGENSAYEFNGKDSVISIPNSPSIMSPKDEFSVVAWVNAYGWSKVGKYYSPVLTKSDTRENSFQYRLVVSKNGMSISITNTHNFAIFPISLEFNQWHMLTITIKHGNAKGYYDGIYIGEKEIIGPLYTDSKPLLIGYDLYGVQTVFNGKIDDIRIYNRELAADDIEKLFNLPY